MKKYRVTIHTNGGYDYNYIFRAFNGLHTSVWSIHKAPESTENLTIWVVDVMVEDGRDHIVGTKTSKIISHLVEHGATRFGVDAGMLEEAENAD